MEKFSKTINRCQISGKKDLKTIISLGFLPPVNKLRKINSLNQESIFFPTDLKYSKSSKLVQLTNIVDKTILLPSKEVFFITPIPTAVCGSTSIP